MTQLYRPTQAIIDLGAIEKNVTYITEKYQGYQYYMGVVKADCYGYRGHQVVDAILKGGANALAVSLIEEGLDLRQAYQDIPILLFTPVPKSYLDVCCQHHLIVTVATYAQALHASQIAGLEVMIRVNGGSDILGGPTSFDQFEAMYEILKHGKCHIKGIYLHSYNAFTKADTEAEYQKFYELTQDIDLSQFEIISIESSLTLPRYQKLPIANCCRMGNIMYGIETEDPNLLSTFCLKSQVLSTLVMQKDQYIAYDHAYQATQDNTKIATVPIGFGDGFAKSNIGRNVYINQRPYPIVAITMDITHILVDDDVKENDVVELIANTHHLDEIATHTHGATEEPISALNQRVARLYIQ